MHRMVAKVPPSGMLRHYRGSVLTGPPNRWICDFVFGYTQIYSAHAPQTSHIPKTLSAIGREEDR